MISSHMIDISSYYYMANHSKEVKKGEKNRIGPYNGKERATCWT